MPLLSTFVMRDNCHHKTKICTDRLRLISNCASVPNDVLQSGPETEWDTWEFFPGPTAPGGPMGAHREGIVFIGREKFKTYAPKR